MDKYAEYLLQHQEQHMLELVELLQFKSISADSGYADQVVGASKWVASRLTQAGFQSVHSFPPDTHPIIFGQRDFAPDAPTVLIYGHYDVQPADPLDLWTTDPFTPTVRDGRLYARGATDMKANLLLPIHAFEALWATDAAPKVNFKVLFEGQEEIGSPGLQKFVSENAELLKCDFVVSADCSQWTESQGAIWLGVRGMAALDIDITGPSHDLHSGIYGGGVQNPIHALVELLSTLHDENGRVSVPGFYDQVLPLTQSERDAIAKVPYDEETFKAEPGLPAAYGEAGYSTYERLWARPTLEVNGIWGGYQGEGPKTIIPAAAHAKITCRLVADQNPAYIVKVVRDYLENNAPVGVKVTIRPHQAAARAYSASADLPGNIAAAAVLFEEYGSEPLHVRSGGSVPIYDMFKTALGAETVMFGFGLEDENLHSPNEFIRLSSIERGRRAYCNLFERITNFPRKTILQ